MNSEKILTVDQLSIAFPQHAPVVDHLSFSIRSGETVSLVGESGSGKSLASLAIMRLLPAAAKIIHGQVCLQDTPLLTLPEYQMRRVRGNKISMIFQEPMVSLNPVISIGEQIAEVLRIHARLGARQARMQAIALLERVGIAEASTRVDDFPHQFSGGMKQRVMIACAIASRPKVLIADEPTTALDVTTQAQVLELIKTLQYEQGMSVLFVSHDLGVVAKMADQVIIMRRGITLEKADTDRFFKQPQHEYSQGLLAALPSMEKRAYSLLTGEQWPAAKQVSSAEPVLSVQDVKIHFPIQTGILKRTTGYIKAVDGVSLTLRRAKTLALVGESGCGKTTLGRAVLRLLQTTAGSIRYEGTELTALSHRSMNLYRRKIQMVFQDPYSSMNPRMLVGDILEEGLKALCPDQDKRARHQRVSTLLQHVGLPADTAMRYPHEFSGGQRQRICIARALAVDPSLLVLDEPTSALDVSVQAQILDLLKQLQCRLGLSYLFITHDISVVAYFADDIAVIQRGRVVEQGPVIDVLSQPQNPYTQSLLSAVPG